ncbi:MAG TPA: FliG C-terminal domain-containing protein, partial [Paracoccus sp. (in: a-proteobacteria)]|nr:FliG C-terminal domain-containing protein [Paracoccus sp. (in: a-proteobacteria)]
APPVEKLGALLNLAPSAMRDTVLAGLDREDAGFAGKVRRTIFTWAHIPARIDPRDVPRILREIDPPTLTRAMAGAQGDDAATVGFLLGAISSRLADTLREDIEAAGKVGTKDAEAAMNTIMAVIRRMETAGDLLLIPRDQEEEPAS